MSDEKLIPNPQSAFRIPHSAFRTRLRRYPRLRRAARRLYRMGQLLVARAALWLRGHPPALIDVDPQAIQTTVALDDPTLRGNATWHFGAVAGGDWDLGGAPVRAHGDVFAILAQHVRDGRPLAEIPEAQAHLRAIADGRIVDSCTTPAEYAARWDAIIALYHAIRRDGYRTQAALGSDNPLDEIRIQIGRRGELLFEEGLHRLAIAQLLELPSVPALVTRRHAAWAALRDAVLKIVLQRGFIHQPLDHPDLDSLPLLYGRDLHQQAFYGDARWPLIRDSLPVAQGTVLDIGAYFGYFDHRLEALGFTCYAVEPDPDNLAVLRRHCDMRGRAFTIWPCSLFDIERRAGIDLARHAFDVVLALNIFHHLVRTQADHDQLVAFLQRLRCRALYLEPDANAGVDAYRRFSDAEFVAFVQRHTGLSQARLLGRAQEGRNVYLLS
jgi:SAM-dependent methyltransferase